MEFTSDYKERRDDIIALFTSTFTASEGAEAGQLIGELVTDMFATVDARDIFVFCALADGAIAGAIVFTRMSYPQDERTVFILAPVAVATGRQGTGIGQLLIRYGLQGLREHGVEVALTYGDINFYAKVGFRQITEAEAQPPLPLQYPDGWLGRSLTRRPLDPLIGPSSCVDALNDPRHW